VTPSPPPLNPPEGEGGPWRQVADRDEEIAVRLRALARQLGDTEGAWEDRLRQTVRARRPTARRGGEMATASVRGRRRGLEGGQEAAW